MCSINGSIGAIDHQYTSPCSPTPSFPSIAGIEYGPGARLAAFGILPAEICVLVVIVCMQVTGNDIQDR
jgi:hypothetical protein